MLGPTDTPANLRYTKEHEWVRMDKGAATVGITDYAQQQLGDITFVELPAVGLDVAARGQLAVVESVKAASEVYAPVAGKVTEVNEALRKAPELVNADPYGGGWICRLAPARAQPLSGLLEAAAYRGLIEGP